MVNHLYHWHSSMNRAMLNISSIRIYPKQRLDVLYPKLEEDDIVMVGSLCAEPGTQEKILELLDQAREKKAIIYYDPNFRSSHKNEAMKLAPTIIENLNTPILYGDRWKISSICMVCKTWTRYIKTRLNSTARGLYARPVGTKYHFVPIWSAKNIR